MPDPDLLFCDYDNALACVLSRQYRKNSLSYVFQANCFIFLVLDFTSGDLSRHFLVELGFIFGCQAAPNESEDLQLFSDNLTKILKHKGNIEQNAAEIDTNGP